MVIYCGKGCEPAVFHARFTLCLRWSRCPRLLCGRHTDELNEKLEAQAEGAQLYIVTIDSLPLGKTIEDYSIEQAERIGAGDSKEDNGVLYTFVKSTHQDRLEVGYGLEDRLTDSVCSKILDSAHGYYRDGDIKAGVKDPARAFFCPP